MWYQGWDEILVITLISSEKLGGYNIMRNTVTWLNTPNSVKYFYFSGSSFVENFEILREFVKIRNLELEFVRAMW